MKKRALTILLALVLLVNLLPIVSASALTASMFVYTSNGKGLNMRDYPSTDADITAVIPYGACIDVYSGWNDTWAHVSYNGLDGYCMSRYLDTSKPAAHQSNNGGGSTGGTTSSNLYADFVDCHYTVTVRPSAPGGFVHMRWAPSKKQPIHQDYYAGSELTVIAQNGEWSQVYDEANGVGGFMMSSFLVSR